MRRTSHHPYTEAQRAELQGKYAALLTQAETALADPVVREAVDDQLAQAAPSIANQTPVNRALLMLQGQHRDIPLTDIDTYDGWRAHGRLVRRGEEALRILPHGSRPEGLRASPDGTRPPIVMLAVFDISQTSDTNHAGAVPTPDREASAATTAATRPRPRSTPAQTTATTTRLRTITSALNALGFDLERTGSAVRADSVARRVFVPEHLTEEQAAQALQRLRPAIERELAADATMDTRPPARAADPTPRPALLARPRRGTDTSEPAARPNTAGATAPVTTRQPDAATPSDGPATPPTQPAAAGQEPQLPTELAQQWPDAADLITRSHHLSPTQQTVLEVYQAEHPAHVVAAAQREVIAAAVAAERDQAYRIAAASPAGLAAAALVVRDTVSDRSFQALVQPWAHVLATPAFGCATGTRAAT
ncbi:vegetative cell wall protein gp1 [Kutzneria sp. 744]|nr:vegetative cell wall protein gp1 [Kutzneria sp. 744]